VLSPGVEGAAVDELSQVAAKQSDQLG